MHAGGGLVLPSLYFFRDVAAFGGGGGGGIVGLSCDEFFIFFSNKAAVDCEVLVNFFGGGARLTAVFLACVFACGMPGGSSDGSPSGGCRTS